MIRSQTLSDEQFYQHAKFHRNLSALDDLSCAHTDTRASPGT